MSKFKPYTDGTWITVTRIHKVACCDCGLTHVYQFRIRNGQVQWRAYRDNRATANVRRARKKAA